MFSKLLPTQLVDGIPYFVHPQGRATVRGATTHRPIPAVLINANDPPDLSRALEIFQNKDDVFSKAFTTTVIAQLDYGGVLYQMREDRRCSPDFQGQLLSRITEEVLPSGPYFLVDGNVHQAWRLYDDVLGSFMTAVYPEDCIRPSKYNVLHTSSLDGMWRTIAVPSRLYNAPTAERPLAGKRVSIKDIHDIKGIKTTLSSRDWASSHGPADDTADYVRHLIELGAVIVGKSMTTAFAGPDEPTDLWVDFHCPTNPRGDLYQSPSGSTTGGAASLAGYEWLDFAVGSDSGGSIRAPATANGLFALRPSYGVTSMKGNVINLPGVDTIGLLDRSIHSLHTITQATMELADSTTFPSRIIYPLDFFPHSDANQQAMVDEFVTMLEQYLGIKRTVVTIADVWDKSPPPEAHGKKLKAYLEKSLFWPRSRDYYNVIDKFRQEFKKRTGRDAYLGTVVAYRYGVGKDVSESDALAYWEEQRIFRDWFSEHIMTTDPESLSSAIMIMPYGSGKPKYRDEPNGGGNASNGFGEQNLAIVLQAPQLVVPIGQNPYASRISGRQEYRPICTTLMGAKGSDLMLTKLAASVLEAGRWPTEVLTGRYTFALGNNTRNVALEPTRGTTDPSK